MGGVMHRATHKGILHDRVLAMVRRIRRRWRTRIAVRGMAIVLGAGLLAFLLSVYGLEVSRFSASSVVTFRVILWLVGAATDGPLPHLASRAESFRRAGRPLSGGARALTRGLRAGRARDVIRVESGLRGPRETARRECARARQRCRFWAPDRAEGSLPGIRTTRRPRRWPRSR